MNIQKPFESEILGSQNSNILILENVVDFVDIFYTIGTKSFSCRYTAINGIVEIDVLDVTKMMYVYDDDVFDYSGTVTYGVYDNYHLAWLSYNIQDNSGGAGVSLGTYVLNGSLQIGENLLMDDFRGNILNEGMIKMPVWYTFTHNTGVYYPKSVSTLTPSTKIERVVDVNSNSSESIEATCGAYIKWLNHKGSYSYWMFYDNKEKYKTKSKGKIIEHWTDRITAKGSHKYLGFETTKTKYINDTISNEYINEVLTLIDSPEVYLYTGDLVNHSWLRCGIRSNPTIKTHTNTTKISIELEMPKQYTVTK